MRKSKGLSLPRIPLETLDKVFMGPTRDFVKSWRWAFFRLGLLRRYTETGSIAGNERALRGCEILIGDFLPFWGWGRLGGGGGFLKCPGVTLVSPQVTSNYVCFTCGKASLFQCGGGSELDDFRGEGCGSVGEGGGWRAASDWGVGL